MRALIAGLGNVFHSDDGFGVAVAEALRDTDLPQGVEVRDFGIRGVHLAYQLLDGYDLLVIVDTVQRGHAPGSLYVIEHGPAPARDEPGGSLMDAHDMAPDEVLALVPMLGGTLGRTVVVGCEPAELGAGMGLSADVARSVERAAGLVVNIVRSTRRPGTPLSAGGK